MPGIEAAVGVSRRDVTLGAKKFAPIVRLSLREPDAKEDEGSRGRSSTAPAKVPLTGFPHRVPPTVAPTKAAQTPEVEEASQTKEGWNCRSCVSRNWCFVVLIACFLNNAFIFGSAQALSFYLHAWKDQYCTTKTVVGFVPALAICMINMTSLTLPSILAKFSHRMVIVFGACLATLGAFGMAFATHLPLLFLAVVVTHVGASFVHVPGMILTGEVFMQSGRSAMGYAISETGSAIGPMALTPLFNALLKIGGDSVDPRIPEEEGVCERSASGKVKYPMLLTAGLFSLMIAFGFLMRSADKTVDQQQEKRLLKSVVRRNAPNKSGRSGRKKEEEEEEDAEAQSVRERVYSMAAVPLKERAKLLERAGDQRRNLALEAANRAKEISNKVSFKRSVRRHQNKTQTVEPMVNQTKEEGADMDYARRDEFLDDCLETMEEELSEMTSTSRFDFAIFKDLRFLFYILYVCVHAGGLVTILILHPSYFEQAKQFTSDQASTLVTGMAGADVAARIIFSLLASNKKIASVAVYFFLAAEYGIFVVLFCYVAVPSAPDSGFASVSFATQMAASVTLGFLRGVWAVNTWTLQANIFGAENLSKVAGFSQFGGGIVILAVPPLLTTFDDFAYIPVAAGGLIVISALLLSTIIFYPKRV